MAYAVGLGVSAYLLASFGHFRGATVAVIVQEVLVLGFPASFGTAAVEVVL